MFEPGNERDEIILARKGGRHGFSTEFRAMVNKNLSIAVYESKTGTTILVIKKELSDYEIECYPSEAPEKNDLGGEKLPWEIVVADTSIFTNEVFKINSIIKEILGTSYDLRLDSIRLCIGNENEYVTIDETDLEDSNITPTLKGLKEFILSTRMGVKGFTIRHYDPKRGNLIFLESSIDRPNYEIKSIKVSIISSLQNRGYYMQQEHKPYGLQLYIVMKVRELSDLIVKLLEKLGIPIEIIYLRRTSAINKWQALECEINENNLFNYLKTTKSNLTNDDVKNIIYFAKRNHFEFEIIDKMADILDKLKYEKKEKSGYIESFNMETIAAAANIVLYHFGIFDTKLELPSGLNNNLIVKRQNDLLKFI
ncbi:MAG: hypothetical protein ACTSRP_00390 [Candidatus Helarchaeota archaeon]